MRRVLPAAWLGLLAGVAGLATPAAFAVLARPDAGRVVAWVLQRETVVSLVLGAALLLLARRRAWRGNAAPSAIADPDTLTAMAAIGLTVLGGFGIPPLMAAARAGQGAWSFGALHAAAAALFGLKALLLAVLALRRDR